jgi:hypothetical protein
VHFHFTDIYYGPSLKIQEKLNKDLNLPATGHEQDWDLELCDSERINEFIDYYKSLSEVEEKQAVMALIFASINYSEGEDSGIDDRAWAQVQSLLEVDYLIMQGVIAWWIGESGQADFDIAPYLVEWLQNR